MTEELQVPEGEDIHLDDEGNVLEPPKAEEVEEDERPVEQAEDAGDDEAGHADETEEEAEARRERNRKRRAENKQRRRDHVESLKREIAARDELLQSAMQRLDAVERRAQGADMAIVDTELRKAYDAYTYYRNAHADAVSRSDGAAAVDAQERMMQINQRAAQLKAIKDAAEQAQKQPKPQPLDPRLRNYASEWLDRNNWYDPDAKDEDSALAFDVDRRLAQQGWDPTTEAYWKELDSRLRKYLPHRYGSGYNKPQRNLKSPVAGSGRESGNSSGGGHKLSSERVQALKDSGLWDDPKQRAEAIKRFQEYDRNHGRT